MSWEILGGAVLIFLARIVDVTLGTLRTVAVVRGNRPLAFGLGFVELIVWVVVVAQVITNLKHVAFVIAFALGYATGTTVGISIERWLAIGHEVVRVFSAQGPVIAGRLRENGFRVTQFAGSGRDGEVYLLFVQVRRRRTAEVVRIAREVDPSCFYTVEDVRTASLGTPRHEPVTHDHLV